MLAAPAVSPVSAGEARSVVALHEASTAARGAAPAPTAVQRRMSRRLMSRLTRRRGTIVILSWMVRSRLRCADDGSPRLPPCRWRCQNRSRCRVLDDETERIRRDQCNDERFNRG